MQCLLYGQDVGRRLGGVFREAATLAEKFGDNRVFNTPIQEAFIIGSTVGMSAVGLKPVVEVQSVYSAGPQPIVYGSKSFLLFIQWKMALFLHHPRSHWRLRQRRPLSLFQQRGNGSFQYSRHQNSLSQHRS